MPSGCRDVVSIGRSAATHDFGVNLSTTRLGMFIFFKHQTPRTFAHDKTITVEVKGARGRQRVIVARRKGMHRIEASDARYRDGSSGSSGHHHLAFAEADVVERIDDGMGRRGASRHRGVVGATEAIFDGHHASRHVDNHLGDKERAETRCAVGIGILHHLVIEMVDASDARGNHHTDVVKVGVFGAETRIDNGFVGSDNVELREEVVFAGRFLVEKIVGVVPFHLAGKMGLE